MPPARACSCQAVRPDSDHQGVPLTLVTGPANAAKAGEAWAAAKEAGADMLALPEMFITGYQKLGAMAVHPSPTGECGGLASSWSGVVCL